MDTLLSRITPGQVSHTAKVFTLLVASVLAIGYVSSWLTLELAGIGAFFLATGLLLAFPGQRSSELLGALAVWLTYAEFMAAIQNGQFDLWRWAVVLATLSLVIVPLKVQHLRQLARSNAYQPISAQDRRSWSGTGRASAPKPYAPAALAAITFDAGFNGKADGSDALTAGA
jgi:hypothetical protein